MSLLQRLPDRLSVWCRWLAGLGWGLLMACAPALAQLAVPALSSHVVDTTGTLGVEQVQQLERKLKAFEQGRGAQIVLLLVPTTQPEDIASYANRVANTWKIGRRDIGDGLLLLVVKNERKVRIEVAKTLEGAIPDLAAKRIIDQAITPRFRQGDFAGGLDAAVDQIMARISGEALPTPVSEPDRGKAGFQWMDLAIFVFFAVPALGALARRSLGPKLGTLATGGAVGALALFITSSLLIASLAAVAALLFTLFSNFARSSGGAGWRSGHAGGWSSGAGAGGFGGGGGGFSSGGGGNFGGGGASGDW